MGIRGCFSSLCWPRRSRPPIATQDAEVFRATSTYDGPPVGKVRRDCGSSPTLEYTSVISAAICCSPENRCVLVKRLPVEGGGGGRNAGGTPLPTLSLPAGCTNGSLHTWNGTAVNMIAARGELCVMPFSAQCRLRTTQAYQ